MTTLSLQLPAWLATRLEDEAKAQQKPQSALVRDFLEQGLRRSSDRPVSFHGLAKTQCGKGHSVIRDLATNRRHLEDYGA